MREELLTSEEADECISIEFNPVRAGFHGSHEHDVWTRDVLNLGVKPDKLINKVTACAFAARLACPSILLRLQQYRSPPAPSPNGPQTTPPFATMHSSGQLCCKKLLATACRAARLPHYACAWYVHCTCSI